MQITFDLDEDLEDVAIIIANKLALELNPTHFAIQVTYPGMKPGNGYGKSLIECLLQIKHQARD